MRELPGSELLRRIVPSKYAGSVSAFDVALYRSAPQQRLQMSLTQPRHTDAKPVRLLLEPGDVLAMHGEARYRWTHAIEATTEDRWQGRRIPRGMRASITLRRVCAAGWGHLQHVPQ
jgi:hypothetical protein